MSFLKKPLLSILVPGIRTYNWEKLYRSVIESTSLDFEIIFCGPNLLPRSLTEFYNVKYIRDFGSPVRCQNIASLLAEGLLITWIADDGLCLPNAIDHCLYYFLAQHPNEKTCVVWKYIESNNNYPDQYYYVMHHEALRAKYIPKDSLIFNGAIMYTSFLRDLGGLDAKYQTPSWAHTDLGLRAKVCDWDISLFRDLPIVSCYQEKEGGDHAPIAEAFTKNDMPYYKAKFNDPFWPYRQDSMDINKKWSESDYIWAERFDTTKPYLDLIEQ